MRSSEEPGPSLLSHPRWERNICDRGVADGEVHVWQAVLDCPDSVLQMCRSVLSQDELERAGRFAFERDRARYTVARGLLRVLLGRYLGLRPRTLRFAYSPFGKPFLGEPCVPPAGLRFNVSHSGGLALLAFFRGGDLGVDLEEIRPEFASMAVARQFFSEKELRELEALPPERRTLAFFLCWTRKEAFVKARGEGLSLPLAAFDVTLTPGMPARLHDVRCEGGAGNWRLVHLDTAPGFVGALVTDGRPSAVVHIRSASPADESGFFQ